MNAKLILPVGAIVVFGLGFLLFLSPSYITGGVIGIFTGCKGGELREYVFGTGLGKHIFEDLASMLLGVILMIASSIFALANGLAQAIVSSSDRKGAIVAPSENQTIGTQEPAQVTRVRQDPSSPN